MEPPKLEVLGITGSFRRRRIRSTKHVRLMKLNLQKRIN